VTGCLPQAAFLVAGLAGSLGIEPASAANDGERRLRGMVNEARDRRLVRTLNMRRFLVRAARCHSPAAQVRERPADPSP
jgi:hypothetical protein